MSVDTKAWCGIDFGTSNSAVGISTAAGNRLATVEKTHSTIPTAIFFNFEEKRMQFGRDATAEYIGRTQGRYMRGLKSLLGSSLIEEQVALGSEALSYKGVIGKFLGYLKGCMEQEVDAPVQDVVIGRPVHLVDDDLDADRRAQEQLEFAAKGEGFRNVAFQLEPIAAALEYEQTVAREEVVLVVDIGGGTSDFSIVRLSPERKANFDRGEDILSSQGVHIGGTDFDKSLSLSRVMPQLGFHTVTRHRRLELPKWCFVDLATWHRIQSLNDPKVILELRKIRHEAERRDLFDRLLWIVNQRLGHRLAGEVEEAKVALTAPRQSTSNLPLNQAISPLTSPGQISQKSSPPTPRASRKPFR